MPWSGAVAQRGAPVKPSRCAFHSRQFVWPGRAGLTRAGMGKLFILASVGHPAVLWHTVPTPKMWLAPIHAQGETPARPSPLMVCCKPRPLCSPSKLTLYTHLGRPWQIQRCYISAIVTWWGSSFQERQDYSPRAQRLNREQFLPLVLSRNTFREERMEVSCSLNGS